MSVRSLTRPMTAGAPRPSRPRSRRSRAAPTICVSAPFRITTRLITAMTVAGPPAARTASTSGASASAMAPTSSTPASVRLMAM